MDEDPAGWIPKWLGPKVLAEEVGKGATGTQFKVRKILSFFILLHLPVDLITKYNIFLFCPQGQTGDGEKCSDMIPAEPKTLK